MKTTLALRLLGSLGLAAAISCKAYDEGRLTERWVPATNPIGTAGGGAAGSANAGRAGGPEAGAAGLPGAGTDAAAGGPAAGGPAAGSSGSTGAAPRCGDGRLDPGETCDTAIAEGTSGSCPTRCEAPDSCERWELRGSACNVTCAPAAILCIADDGCCPSDCTSANDTDCVPVCGDGLVQAERGETCEPNPAAGMPQCPAAADCDDADPCTSDALSGSASLCTARCTHEPVQTARDGDGCCPSGAAPSSDSDCAATCGNGVREGSEECDGSAGCSTACQLELTGAQAQCLERFSASGCEACQCEHCSDEMLACRASGSARRDAACSAVEQCSTEHDCAGTACYCSASVITACAFRPDGPCRRVIEDAAGSSLSLRIQAEYNDPASALGRARALGECRRRSCPAECQ